MTRRVRLFVLLSAVCSVWPALAAETVPDTASRWESLWRNTDQRGAQLLRRGDAAGAARVFADPRHKAYAELLAGDYAGAAKSLSAFDDGEAHYNRGNALAHAGQLPEALKAYNAALKHDPRNADALRNRDLVAKALQQQKPQTPPPEKQNAGDNTPRDGKSQAQSGNGEDRQSGQSDPNGQQAQPSANDAKAANDPKGRDGQSQPKSPDGKPPTGQGAKSAATQPQAQDRNAAGGSSDKPESGAKSQPAGSLPDTATAKNQDSAEQARRDAEASLAAKAPRSTEAASPGDAGQTGNATSGAIPKAPPTEKQLAQAQWLRSIPDDPGGLLRRKFMIEHYMRQRNESP